MRYINLVLTEVASKNMIMIILENIYMEITSKWYINSAIKTEKTIEVHWQESSEKKIMLEGNKNYVTLALICILKNSKGTISASEIRRKCKNNNIK